MNTSHNAKSATVVLILLLALPMLITTLPTPKIAFATTLYSDDYESASIANYTTWGATWYPANVGAPHNYVMYGTENGAWSGAYFTGGSAGTGTYNVSLYVIPISGFYYGGFVLRQVDTSNFYFVWLAHDNTGYAGSLAGYRVDLMKRVGGVDSCVGAGAASTNTADLSNQWVGMSVVANGTNFLVYLNNALEINVTDSAFSTGTWGYIGLYYTQYDDLLITDTVGGGGGGGGPSNATITFDTSPSGYTDGLNIDGTNYTGPTPFNWTVGSTHNITANNEVNSTWVIWASTYSNVTFFDSTAQQTNLTVLGDDSVTANFSPPQPVAFDTGPASGYTDGLTIDGVNYTGPVTLYWMMGSSHNITANDETGGVAFTHWTQLWGNVVFGSATANQTTITIYGNDNITAVFASHILINDSFTATNVCPTNYFTDKDCWGAEVLNTTVYKTSPSSADVNVSTPAFAWVSSRTGVNHLYVSANVYVSGIANDDSTDSPYIVIGDYSYGSPIIAFWYTDSTGWNVFLATGTTVPLGGNITQNAWLAVTLDWDISGQANFTVGGVLIWSGDSLSTGMVNAGGITPTVSFGHSGFFLDTHGYAATNTPTYLVDDVVMADIHLAGPSSPTQYYITYTTDGHGTLNQTSGFVNDGTAVNVLATANANYTFSTFVDSINGNSTSNPYGFTVTANITITAYFNYTPVGYQVYLTFATDGHGSVNQTSGWYNLTLSVNVLASNNANYTFLNFVDSIGGNSTANPYTFTVTGNATITAYFNYTPIGYQVYITFTTDGHGTLNQTSGWYNLTLSVTVFATHNSNYTFSHLVDSIGGNSTSNPYTFTVTANATITAYFTGPTGFTISFTYYTQDGSSTSDIQINYTTGGVSTLLNITKSYQGVTVDIGTYWVLMQNVTSLPDGWFTEDSLTANATGPASYNFTFTHTVANLIINEPNNDLGYAPFQHKYFRTGTLYWQFFQTGTEFYVTTSSDEVTWSTPTSIYNDASGTPISRNFAVAFDSTSSGARVHVVIQTADHTEIIYRTGITSLAGTITWSQAWQVVSNSTAVYNYPNIALDSFKLPWISIDDTTTGDVAKVWRSTTSSGLWTTAAGFPVIPDSGGIGYRGAFVALTGGKMYFMDTDPKLGFTYIDTRTILPNGTMTAFVNTTHSGSDSFDGIGIGDVAHVVFGSWGGGTYYFNYTYATNTISTEVAVNATEYYSTIARDTDFLYVLMADATNNIVSWRAMNLTSFAWGSTTIATFDTNGLLLNGIQSESMPNSTKILTFTFATIDPTSGYDLRWSWLNTTVDPPTVTVYFTTNPIIANALGIDSVNYTGPQTLVWYVDTLHNATAFDMTGYTFNNWSDSGTQSQLIYALDSIDGTTYTAYYLLIPTTVLIIITTNPSNFTNPITVNGTTYAIPYSANWTIGSNYTVVALNMTGYAFDHWSDGGAQNHTITAPNATTTYIAFYDPLGPGTVIIIITTNPNNLILPIMVDGLTYDVPYTANWTIGSNHTIVANSIVGYNFRDWSDGGAQTHSVLAPATATTYTANYAQVSIGGGGGCVGSSCTTTTAPVVGGNGGGNSGTSLWQALLNFLRFGPFTLLTLLIILIIIVGSIVRKETKERKSSTRAWHNALSFEGAQKEWKKFAKELKEEF